MGMQPGPRSSQPADDPALVAAMRGGDTAAFTALTEPYRRQLHVHCYRMLGSFVDADDLVQETLLRAWRGRAGFRGGSLVRTWLYRIATNACLTALARRQRRILPPDIAPPADATLDTHTPPAWRPELPWLEPYPDDLLEAVAPEDLPERAAVERETIELAYLAAVQYLPPRQRAIFLLRDALGWSEAETAALLEASLASVKSALTRARATMRTHLPSGREAWTATPRDEGERAALERFVAAYQRSDASALAAVLREDARQTMPPALLWFDGREAIVAHHARLLDGSLGAFRLVPVWANRQLAAAAYLRRPSDAAYRLTGLNVLRVDGERIAEITSFSPELCRPFELPVILPPEP
jgi:RNA polymerase sigma-70 factor (ECF subfamily)